MITATMKMIDDDIRMLICDGCIQPITVSQPSYYACTQCGFFLHSFCPTKLTVGASPSHPNHSLLLRKTDRFCNLEECGVCCILTNGFHYNCQTCDIKIDIRCAFLPTRIKHTSHNSHSLVQSPSSSGAICTVTRFLIKGGVKYAFETCSSFRIHIPHPPFFYEGVFYCEICEEQVNNQRLLYHCSDSDHSFHYECFSLLINVKLGGTIHVKIDNKPHRLTLVLKRPTRKKSTFSCSNCFDGWNHPKLLFECDGCGYLLCSHCAPLTELVKKSQAY